MIIKIESLLFNKNYILGADECGTGCLAGPLVVCGVKAPKDWSLDGLNDSKKLSAKKREVMRTKLNELIKNKVINYYLASRSNIYIDKVGMAQALKEAYVEIFHNLYCSNSLIISDGILKFDNMNVDDYDKISIIKADTKIPAVMAASILGKTYRDNQMQIMHQSYPQYDWKSNMGYGSAKHLTAIKEFGPSPLHRFSYAPMKNM